MPTLHGFKGYCVGANVYCITKDLSCVLFISEFLLDSESFSMSLRLFTPVHPLIIILICIDRPFLRPLFAPHPPSSFHNLYHFIDIWVPFLIKLTIFLWSIEVFNSLLINLFSLRPADFSRSWRNGARGGGVVLSDVVRRRFAWYFLIVDDGNIGVLVIWSRDLGYFLDSAI
jgi:hypothetical protein